MLEFEDSRLKRASGTKKDDSTAAPLMEVPPENTEVEALPSRGSNGYGKRKQLPRAKSDLGPGDRVRLAYTTAEEENWELRHGWEDQYNSNEYLSFLTSVSRHMIGSFRLEQSERQRL
jgi:regulator-associated protein of mTOR